MRFYFYFLETGFIGTVEVKETIAYRENTVMLAVSYLLL